MPEFKEIVERMARNILEANPHATIDDITPEIVKDFIADKKDYLENYDEWDYELEVYEKIQEILKPIEEKQEKSKQKKTAKKQEKKDLSKELVKKSQKAGVKTKQWEFKCYSGLFKKLISRVRPLANEFKLKIGKDGISTLTVDPAHVCMIDLFIPRKDFYKGNSCVNKNIYYKLKEEFEIGIDIDKLERVMKLFTQFDIIDGYVQNNCLYLDTEKIHKKLTLINIYGFPDAVIPKIEFDVRAKVSNSDIGLLVKAINGDVSIDYLTLVSDSSGFYSEIPEDEDDLRINLCKEVKGKGKAMFSGDYFTNIVKELTHWQSITMEFSTDSPLRLSGEVYDNGKFTYLLAPRINSNGSG